jgi:hypothetical protein
MSRSGYVARIEGNRKACSTSVENPEGKKQLGRPGRRRQNIIKIMFKWIRKDFVD